MPDIESELGPIYLISFQQPKQNNAIKTPKA
jgi:hypothetical protein